MGKLYCKIRNTESPLVPYLYLALPMPLYIPKVNLSISKCNIIALEISVDNIRFISAYRPPRQSCASTPSSTNNFQAPPAPSEHRQPPSHEQLHTLRMNENHARLSPALVETCAGLSAGAISTLVVHPLDIIKTRLQSTPPLPLHFYPPPILPPLPQTPPTTPR